eukprot:4900109-Amphidinium_carterae.1
MPALERCPCLMLVWAHPSVGDAHCTHLVCCSLRISISTFLRLLSASFIPFGGGAVLPRACSASARLYARVAEELAK